MPRCITCETSAAFHELKEQKCIDCLAKENAEMREIIQALLRLVDERYYLIFNEAEPAIYKARDLGISI